MRFQRRSAFMLDFIASNRDQVTKLLTIGSRLDRLEEEVKQHRREIDEHDGRIAYLELYREITVQVPGMVLEVGVLPTEGQTRVQRTSRSDDPLAKYREPIIQHALCNVNGCGAQTHRCPSRANLAPTPQRPFLDLQCLSLGPVAAGYSKTGQVAGMAVGPGHRRLPPYP
jgi:hypothetical protein